MRSRLPTKIMLLPEEDAWRLALTWQKALQERVRLVPSTTSSPRIVKSYEWVGIQFNGEENVEEAMTRAVVMQYACSVWFALSCCEGYSGRENPIFWKRVFAELQRSKLEPSARQQPVWNSDEYKGLVEDSIRFFDRHDTVFPRVQLSVDRLNDTEKEAAIYCAFFGCSNEFVKGKLHQRLKKVALVAAAKNKQRQCLSELAPFVKHEPTRRIVPVSLSSSMSASSLPQLYHLLTLLPTMQTPSEDDAAPLKMKERRSRRLSVLFVITHIPRLNPSSLVNLLPLSSLLHKHQIIYDSHTMSVVPLTKRKQYADLLLPRDNNVLGRVKSVTHRISRDADSFLDGLCAALPHTRALQNVEITMWWNETVTNLQWAWLGYALFHPDAPSSSWSSLSLGSFQLTHDAIEVLRSMSRGNNLLAIRLGLKGDRTTYESARVRVGSMVHAIPRSDADVLFIAIEETVLDICINDYRSTALISQWICVVVPGVGLGWIEKSDVVHLISRGPSVVHLKNLTLHSETTSSETIQDLLALIGEKLEYLDMQSKVYADDLEFILNQCTSLKSLRTHHDGSVWTRMLRERSQLQYLEEVVFRLPRETAWLAPPSDVALETLLRKLKTLRIEGFSVEDFGVCRETALTMLWRIPTLQYFHFDCARDVAALQNDPLPYGVARALSWDKLSVEPSSIDGFAHGACSRESTAAFLSAVWRLSSTGSACGRFDRGVLSVILGFTTSLHPREIWVANEGTVVQWAPRRQPSFVNCF
ncbi:hypothetical protein Poli38472_001269 [Pythium oligandrum]|uniref:Uncharacterized protein n=1 Tax=Pythium oligandrum TaxID=41045 RepID=A0A8K1CVP4_PYTOL|nr:hypothetical protein Poli38472_001269 [Pythium oligandrum]|eukprot:TMW69113.1 hypothetical protein Poli38472_001269 [Pythium oligandrum]